MRLAVRSALISVILSLSLAGMAQAASFDCKKAASRVEKMICGDVDLDSFDSQIQEAYSGALDRSTHPEQIKTSQRAWLAERDACGDVKCMSDAYQKRIATLSKVSDQPAPCSGSTTPEANACGAEYARRNDQQLTRYLTAARKRLVDEAREDPSSEMAKGALAALNTSQKAWEAYRKAECEAVYQLWSDGTIRGSMFQACMTSVTMQRTEEIWSTWLSFEDSTPPLLPKPVS